MTFLNQFSGVRKLTQTKLNVETFKMARSQENAERSFVSHSSPTSLHDQGFYNIQVIFLL